METWIKINCPFCKKNNWLNNGDPNDMTVTDVEACECWKCNKKFVLDEEFLEEYYEDEQNIEDLFAEKGKEKPD